MRSGQFDHLRIAGLEVVLPAVVAVERGGCEVLAAFAAHDLDAVIAPLIGRWLAGKVGASFRTADGDDCGLAGDVFHDKLSAEFCGAHGCLAALVCGEPHGSGERAVGAFAFMRGGALVRWHRSGPVTAYVNPAHRSALVECDGLPGALSLRCDPLPGSRRAKPALLRAWYGLGRALVPADAVVDAIRAGVKRERTLHG
jgi:hypothetical protein